MANVNLDNPDSVFHNRQVRNEIEKERKNIETAIARLTAIVIVNEESYFFGKEETSLQKAFIDFQNLLNRIEKGKIYND